MSVMAALDRQGVPKSILERDGEKRIEFMTAIGTLQAFSLINTEQVILHNPALNLHFATIIMFPTLALSSTLVFCSHRLEAVTDQ